jgi:hypothetical protein
MKKLTLILSTSIVLISCTGQQMAKQYGGKTTINLTPNERLINITWKDDNSLWILTKNDTTQPQEYKFKENSAFGLIEGEVIIKEQ